MVYPAHTVDEHSKGLTEYPENIPEGCEELLLYANKITKIKPSVGKLKGLVHPPLAAAHSICCCP